MELLSYIHNIFHDVIGSDETFEDRRARSGNLDHVSTFTVIVRLQVAARRCSRSSTTSSQTSKKALVAH